MNQYLYQDPGTARLEEFSTKHELARNFYDDDEFCPIPSQQLPQVHEHRDRIRSRGSPGSSPSSSPTRSNHHGSPLRQSPRTRAVPIVDPSKRAVFNVTQASTNTNSNNVIYSGHIQESHHPSSTPTASSWAAPSRRYGIPIVDPSSGHMIVPSAHTSYQHRHQHTGYYVSVR